MVPFPDGVKHDDWHARIQKLFGNPLGGECLAGLGYSQDASASHGKIVQRQLYVSDKNMFHSPPSLRWGGLFYRFPIWPNQFLAPASPAFFEVREVGRAQVH